jgi:hypothetical protein
MHKMKKHFFFLFSLIPFFINAQVFDLEEVSLIGGVHGGRVISSEIRGLDNVIIPERFFINYTLRPQNMSGWAYGAFINIKDDNSGIGFQLDFDYAEQFSRLDFNNYATDFKYTMTFKNKYFNIIPSIRWYPGTTFDSRLFRGFNIFTGLQIGFSKNASDIEYVSDGAGRLLAFGSDPEQQEQLNQVLKTKSNNGWINGLSIENDFRIGNFLFPIVLEAKYHFGFKDVIRTLPNSYNFAERYNNNNYFQFTLRFPFGMGNRYPDPDND